MVEFEVAVLEAVGQPLRIEMLRITALARDDVLVRVAASGLCHSDLELIDGALRGFPLPCVPGHEAAGVVEAVGADVTAVRVGDHVVCSWNPHCGTCFYCERGLPILCEVYVAQRQRGGLLDGAGRLSTATRPVHHFSFVSAHAGYAVVPESAAIPIPRDMPLDLACLIGCGVMMGVGATTQTVPVSPGSTVVVLGCSIDGLCAVQGAAIAGAACIIAIDPSAQLRSIAAQFGAGITLPFEAARVLDDVLAQSRGRGADYVLEALGTPESFRLAAELARPGGDVVLIGKVDVDTEVAFRWGSLMREKRIIRTSNGGARARTFYPWLARSYLNGTLKLDELVSRRLPLADINDGYAGMRKGDRLRTILVR